MANLKNVLKKHSNRMLKQYKNDGLVGVGISKKTVKGKPTKKEALTLYVEKKIDAIDLAVEQRVDLDRDLLQDISTADVDVKEIGKISALGTGRVRPVVTGCSEGHYRITAGTGSILVKKIALIRRLSNNHVYADSNKGRLGDPIYQPGPYDGGTSTDKVGELVDFYPLDFENSTNLIDAALRSIQPDEKQIVTGLNVTPTKTVKANVGMDVTKSGRTTGVTVGRITDTNLFIRVSYGPEGDVIFQDQILVESTDVFSQGGDSGSAVLTADGTSWVGLLFAGSGDGKYTICNHAVDVEDILGVQLYVDGDAPPPPPPPPPVEEDKFPWLLVVGGILVIGAFIIYLVLTK